MKQLVLVFSIGASLLATASHATDQSECEGRDAVIRQTVPYPHAVRRAPLTSDQLDTASTRLIDARRGYRSYDSAYCQYGSSHSFYRDRFGIIRPVYRRASRRQSTHAGVTTHRGNASQPRNARTQMHPLPPAIIDDQREAVDAPAPKPARIVIHNGQAQLPQVSGAVIIKSDGTVISIGQ